MAERREDAAYFETLLALLPDGELTETAWGCCRASLAAFPA